jgi:uncharacterized phage protein (TIGR01671 family)
MNREIKFRAWDGKKTMVDWFCLTQTAFESPSQNYSLMYTAFTNPDWVLMQYTGLKDKNGREIYEGDIVRWEPQYISIREKPAAVQYTDCGFSPFEYDGGGEWHWSECEVIGNIYENSDLLNENPDLLEPSDE